MNPLELVLDLLGTARRIALDFKDDDTEEVRDEHSTDISTKADRALSKAIVARALALAPGAVLLTEESGRTESEGDADLTIAVDDLDGTDNFFRGRELLPWCSVVTVFKGFAPRFRDALAAGVLEHRSGTIWAASSEGPCFERRSDGTETAIRTSRKAGLDRRSLVAVDHYTARAGVRGLANLHERAWVKDFGSSAFHLALVASGRIEAFVNPAHKGHELGAGYMLITAAGGAVTTMDGDDLANRLFDFDAVYPIVAAASGKIGNTIIEAIKESG
jgi:myo-inositol-1(or 4)-monophosphatase